MNYINDSSALPIGCLTRLRCRALWIPVTMIIVSVVSAPAGECRQQTPPVETSDPYFDAAKSAPAPQAQSSGLQPRPEAPEKDPDAQGATPETGAAQGVGQMTEAPSPDPLPRSGGEGNKIGAASEGNKIGAAPEGNIAIATEAGNTIGGTRNPHANGGQATRLIDQLAAQANQGNVATQPPASNASLKGPSQNEPAAANDQKSRDAFEPGRVLASVGGRPILVGDML